jgi:hypothetical protein
VALNNGLLTALDLLPYIQRIHDVVPTGIVRQVIQELLS